MAKHSINQSFKQKLISKVNDALPKQQIPQNKLDYFALQIRKLKRMNNIYLLIMVVETISIITIGLMRR